ncbi:hypothetical protein PSP31121_05306 [Pandoraea sputorum]|uniref:Uncharacterized protein n=2 Tax=Pandoraea sputorum TaxID=93222 RepID=A0A5E5BI91_9BURK|nr:hypothetical protein PSP31121_05306 [Pandoraea sputorum]
MRVVAVQANMTETAALAKKFAHDEFARVIGVEMPSESDIIAYFLDRLRSMTWTHTDPKGAPTIRRLHDCVYVMPVARHAGGTSVIEAHLLVLPQAWHEVPTYVVISEGGNATTRPEIARINAA